MTEIIAVTANTVDRLGFFCKMSARKTPAWKAKRDWLMARFAEGLQLRLLGSGERGFIEFMPGDKAWRAVEGAGGFVVIHCLWVVGKSKGKGHASALLTGAETWARDQGYHGVAAVTSTGNWLIAPGVLEHHGYEAVETVPPGFGLMLKRFSNAPATPRLSGDWDAKAAACGPGLTVLRSAQCPYLEDAARHAKNAADKLGLAFTDRLIETAADLRRLAPTPYGTYAIVHDGRLVSYHYLLEKQIITALA